MIKICEHCKKQYDAGSSGHAKHRKYCSKKCARAAENKRYVQRYGKERVRKKFTESEQKRKYSSIDLATAATCLNCGCFFNIVRKTDPNTFCSRECAIEHRRKNTKVYTCKHCGKEYEGKDGLHKDIRYCSSACYRIGEGVKPKQHKKVCPICDRKFIASNGNAKYCGDECRKQANLIYQWHHVYKRQIFKKTCKECNITFITHRSQKEYCSQYCANKTRIITLHARRRSQEYERDRDGFIVQNVSYAKVYKRDKGICHICGEPVHKEYNCNDLLSGTLDHIIPLAKGGDHTYENIKLAHMICNSYKSDKVVGGVLG